MPKRIKAAHGLFALFLAGATTWSVGESGSKVADLGTGLLTGSVVGLGLLFVEMERSAHLAQEEGRRIAREKEADRIERQAQQQALQAQESSTRRLLIQQWIGSSIRLEGADFSGEDLSGLFVTQVTLSHVNFKRAKLHGANASGSKIELSDFRSADLTSANFSSSEIINCNFSGAQLADVNFDRAVLRGCNFIAASYRLEIFDTATLESCEGIEAP